MQYKATFLPEIAQISLTTANIKLGVGVSSSCRCYFWPGHLYETAGWWMAGRGYDEKDMARAWSFVMPTGGTIVR